MTYSTPPDFEMCDPCTGSELYTSCGQVAVTLNVAKTEVWYHNSPGLNQNCPLGETKVAVSKRNNFESQQKQGSTMLLH